MDDHCSSLKTINNNGPQDSVLLLTLFLLFINDLLFLTQCPIHSYAHDTTLHFSTPYNRGLTQQELNNSRRDVIGRLTSDLSLLSDWGILNLVLFKNSISTTTILSSSLTLNCLSPPHQAHLVYPLLKILTGNFIPLLLLNQLPRS